MWDDLLLVLRSKIPDELASLLEDFLTAIDHGDFQHVLESDIAQDIFSEVQRSEKITRDSWARIIAQRLHPKSGDVTGQTLLVLQYFLVGYAALLSFLQANFTGPPLPFQSDRLILGEEHSSDARENLRLELSTDGIATYRLIPNPELLVLAISVFSDSTITSQVPLTRWAALRASFIHQRVLSEPSSTLQEDITSSIETVEEMLVDASYDDNLRSDLLMEKASIETYYGNDRPARTAIGAAAKLRRFEFALTGKLGRRTKFQERDISQLVVLARSSTARNGAAPATSIAAATGPKNLDLNDDTLLEAISFTQSSTDPASVVQEEFLPPSLKSLDVVEQPLLDARDSIILLALASAITNTSPVDGLTREETLPYASRVLDGGSSNWQVYTQALLVRSRIEGYKSRTVERGLLQLQAVVDQVILDTATSDESSEKSAQTSFLPQSSKEDSAPAQDRLKYVFQLASPARWDLEAELAQRWISLGGLRSALEIYERLEMWAEAALCWAATDQEDKARKTIRKLLYNRTTDGSGDMDAERWEGPVRDPLPADAPRLFCILGDMDQDPTMYEKAWQVSGNHYARAQRSLGRLYFSRKKYLLAASAYSRSLHVNRLNHGSWFAFGCTLLELEEYAKAAEAFTRCIQLDEQDAEAWSNLAAALLRKDKDSEHKEMFATDVQEEDGDAPVQQDPQQRRHDALRALKRAAAIKHDSFQIWENVLIVAASLDPPDFVSVISAQSRVIDLRGKTVGEKCVDVEIMALVVRQAIMAGSYDVTKPGTERMLTELFDKKITPLITASAPLWSLVAKLAIWRKRPATALDAHEKAWRSVTSQPGWETQSEARWDQVVDSTVDLVDAYESLGPLEVTEGLAAGQGVLVAKDWKFKSRSAIRGIMGRGKDSWEDTDGWARLKQSLDNLRG